MSAGKIIISASSTVPFGCLPLRGQLLDKVQYPRLFQVIGETYNNPEDSDFSKFRLPDSQGRALLSAGQGSGLSNRVLGQKGGESTHTLTENEMASHTHETDDHSHTVSNSVGGAAGGYSNNANLVSSSTQTSATVISVSSVGNSQAHNNVQSFTVFNYFIRY